MVDGCAQYAELMHAVAAEEIDTWPRGETQLLRPRMQALTLEIILRAVMGVTDPARRDALRVALRRLLELLTDPKWTTLFLVIGSHRLHHFPPFRERIADVDDLLFAEIPNAAPSRSANVRTSCRC